MTLQEELDAIRNAPDRYAAANIRNAIALAAQRGERPRADWDEAVEVYYQRWRDQISSRVGGQPPVSGYWGD